MLRHEYGHQVYDGLTVEERAAFRSLFPDPDSVRRDLSIYAKTTTDETFCEAYAVVSDPKFDASVWAPWIGEFRDRLGARLKVHETREAIVPSRPAGSLAARVDYATAGDVVPSAAAESRMLQQIYLTRDLPEFNSDPVEMMKSFRNRSEAKIEIAKKLEARLAGNEAWSNYTSAAGTGRRTVGDLADGEEFHPASAPHGPPWVKIATQEDGLIVVKPPAEWNMPGGVYPIESHVPVAVETSTARIPALISDTFHTGTKSYKAVASLIENWAATSSDSHPWALALQRAAQEEFRLSPRVYETTKHSVREADDVSAADEIFAAHGPALRAFLRAMYDETQESLEAAGVGDTVFLSRGQGFVSNVPDGFSTTAVDFQPMSSFSADIDIARRFMRIEESGGIIAAEVPRSRIIGTARSGFGCLDEQEFVVLAANPAASDTVLIRAGTRFGEIQASAEGGAPTFWARAALDAAKLGPEWRVAYDLDYQGIFEYQGRRLVSRGRADYQGEEVLVGFDEAADEVIRVPLHARVRQLPYPWEE